MAVRTAVPSMTEWDEIDSSDRFGHAANYLFPAFDAFHAFNSRGDDRRTVAEFFAGPKLSDLHCIRDHASDGRR